MNPRKTQHTVPEYYLKEWCLPNTNQVYVYDKIKDEIRTSNIDNIASENYFYDFVLNDFFPEDTIRSLNENGIAVNGRLQIIEKMFSDNLEGPFSDIFSKIIDKARNLTPWEKKECLFVSSEAKEEISVYLAFQFIRTKAVRNSIANSSGKVVELCKKLRYPDRAIDKVRLSKSAVSRIHNRMLLDKENILKSALLFHKLIWVLGINRTSKPFYTSDNPIGIVGHDKSLPPFIRGTGLGTPGVEIFFPLAPDLILIMVDGDYHKHTVKDERRYIELNLAETIEYYNSLITKNAERSVISCKKDFLLPNQPII